MRSAWTSWPPSVRTVTRTRLDPRGMRIVTLARPRTPAMRVASRPSTATRSSSSSTPAGGAARTVIRDGETQPCALVSRSTEAAVISGSC